MVTICQLGEWDIRLHQAMNEREAAHINVYVSPNECYRFWIESLEQLETDVRRAPRGMQRKIREWGAVLRPLLHQAWQDSLAGRPIDKSGLCPPKRLQGRIKGK